MQSPIKALEKLSEEARLERQRSTSSLQENIRLKIQIENLKQHVDHSNAQVQQLEAEISKLNSKVESLEENIERTDYQLAEEHDALVQEQRRASAAEEKMRALREELDDKLEVVATLNSEKESRGEVKAQFDIELRAKDETITVAHEDVQRLERQNRTWEQKYTLLDSAHNDLIRDMEILKLKYAQNGTFSEQLTAQEVSNKELRKELESLMLSAHNYQVEISELKKSKLQLEVREEQQLEELGFYRSQETELRATINELEEMQTQLTSRIAAEEQILEAARSQASVAAKGREFVDLQVRELSDQYDRACEHNRQLEAESTDMRVSLTQCQTELLQAKDKIAQLESVVQTVESNTNLSVEVSYLRTQMADMRKKLIRKDMTDLESGSSSSKALRDRENSSRLVYEGIILDLRTEIERLTVQYHDNQARHEELLKKASRVDQLEEEVRLYKECVTSNGMENDAIHTSYSEALERSEKSSHEKHLILRDLKTVELENESLQTKLTQLTDELNLEKAKYKKMHIDKLAAERRCSELLASRSKAEAALDEVKQGYDTELLELDRLRRGQRESHLVCEDLKRVANESAGREQEAERKSQELRESLTEVLGREQSLKNELSLLQTVKVSVDKELSSLQYTLRNQSAELEQKDVENDNLNKMITDLQREREKLCKDVALQEQSRAEIQLSTLRNELDQTVHDWKTTESVADEYVKEIQRLKQENLNEKEKIKLYKNQIALLEDRVKVALHELSVYRSLDVYHTTVSSELGHVREENLSNSRRSPVHHTHPHQDVPFGSPAAVAVSRGLDIGGSNRSHYSPSQQQQQHYSPQPQYPLREDLYAGVPSHGYGQGLGLSQSQFAARSQSSTLDYSARQHHDRDRDNHQYYQSKDSHWNIDSQVSTSSLPPPPYNHLRLEEELYQQRRQLRAEREAKKEKLLLQELNTGKPAVQSLYSQSHRQAQNLSQSRLDAESSLYSSSAGSTYRYTSPTFERPAPVYTSSMDTSRSIATTSRPKSGNTGAASSDSSALISRLRQSYLSKEGNSDNISKPQSEKLPSYIPSYFPSPSGTVDEPANIGQEHGRDTGSSSRNSNSSLLNKATGSTSMVSKAEYEKAKLRLSRR